MADGGREVSPSRAALFELREEQRVVREGHDVLDNKRMLLAREIQRWLESWDAARRRVEERWIDARLALADAVERHGVGELTATPDRFQGPRALQRRDHAFLGIPLTTLDVGEPTALPPARPANPSPEARRLGEAFAGVLDAALALAAPHENLRRLLTEYRRTERRARALENVILPELAALVKQVDEALEDGDQEDAARVRGRWSAPG